jgi:hypothetical protein
MFFTGKRTFHYLIDYLVMFELFFFVSRCRCFYFNLATPPISPLALGLTQSLTEVSSKNLPAGKSLPARKADNHTAICESIV